MLVNPIGDFYWSFGDGEQSIVLHLLDIPTTLSINATKTEYGY